MILRVVPKLSFERGAITISGSFSGRNWRKLRETTGVVSSKFDSTRLSVLEGGIRDDWIKFCKCVPFLVL